MVPGDHPTTAPTLNKSVPTRTTRVTTTSDAHRTTYMTRVATMLARTRIRASAPCWRATRQTEIDRFGPKVRAKGLEVIPEVPSLRQMHRELRGSENRSHSSEIRRSE